jgi:hypothetical protein
VEVADLECVAEEGLGVGTQAEEFALSDEVAERLAGTGDVAVDFGA